MLIAGTAAGSDSGPGYAGPIVVAVILLLFIVWSLWIARGYGPGNGRDPWK